jgi:hypothetical protein
MKRHSFKLIRSIGSAWGDTYDKDFRPVITEKCISCGMIRLLINGRFYHERARDIYMLCRDFAKSATNLK